LAWRIEIAERAARQIKKLDPPEAARIRAYLRNRLALLDDPRQTGAPLHGSDLGDYWRYRIGDHRILCELRDDELLVLVIEIGHDQSEWLELEVQGRSDWRLIRIVRDYGGIPRTALLRRIQ